MLEYTPKDIARFWAKVDISGGEDVCWIWTAKSVLPEGYGRLRVQRHAILSNRMSWELAYGKIPDGLCVLHTCDNPPCVNPRHLFLGTRKTNAEDRDRKRRNNQLKGEDHGQAKLTWDGVRVIRSRYAAGFIRQCDLATEFGVSGSTISLVIRNKIWREVR